MTARSAKRAARLRSWSTARTVRPRAVAQALEQLDQRELVRDVEVGRRLVEQEEPRLLGEREGDEDALALPARQLVRPVDRRAPRRPHRPGRGRPPPRRPPRSQTSFARAGCDRARRPPTRGTRCGSSMPCGRTVTRRASSPRSHESIGRPNSSTSAGDRATARRRAPAAACSCRCRSRRAAPPAHPPSAARSTSRRTAVRRRPRTRRRRRRAGHERRAQPSVPHRAPQEPEEEGCADQRGHDADRDPTREPRPEVGDEQEQRAVDHARRQQQPMVGPEGEAQQVRHDQPDEADRPRDRDARPRSAAPRAR